MSISIIIIIILTFEFSIHLLLKMRIVVGQSFAIHRNPFRTIFQQHRFQMMVNKWLLKMARSRNLESKNKWMILFICEIYGFSLLQLLNLDIGHWASHVNNYCKLKKVCSISIDLLTQLANIQQQINTIRLVCPTLSVHSHIRGRVSIKYGFDLRP